MVSSFGLVLAEAGVLSGDETCSLNIGLSDLEVVGLEGKEVKKNLEENCRVEWVVTKVGRRTGLEEVAMVYPYERERERENEPTMTSRRKGAELFSPFQESNDASS